MANRCHIRAGQSRRHENCNRKKSLPIPRGRFDPRVPTPKPTVIIEPADDDGTFSVYVPDLPGCISTGRTRPEAIESIREAIQGHIQTLRDLGQDVPPPRSQSQVVAA